jgi:large subunit ribosomal protein L15
MPHRKRKTRKLRGSRTCGWGRVGQHRKAGGRGGRGKAGGHKHFWSYVVKYEPDRFGKVGFKRPVRPYVRPITLSQVAEIVERGAFEMDDKGRIVIDLRSMGYTKLLGSGSISKPVCIVVPRATERAVEKVVSAGGEVRTE